MSGFSPIPLGRRIPGALHSVSCSLPTMRDVIGYEEKRPETLEAMEAGYPRFLQHPCVAELRARLTAASCRPGRTLWPVRSAKVAAALVRHLGGGETAALLGGTVHAAVHDDAAERPTRARLYLQHTGGLIGSREAEDALVRGGWRGAAASEELWAGDAAAEVQRVLGGLFAGTREADRVLAASGMSAMHAAFTAVNAVQAPRGRTAWLQLGWLYLDTIAVLKKFTANPARDYLHQADALDLAALERTLHGHGSRLAGVVVEAPGNPLVQTPAVAAVAARCRAHGVRVVIDPAISSPFNVDVLAHADVVAFSLTKYATPAGDVMAGAAVVNPGGPDAAALRTALTAETEPPYARDLARLAVQIGGAAEVVARVNANTRRVAEFLEQHRRVKRVWWAGQAACRANYRKIARHAAAWGGVISFALREPPARFYDEVRVAKGPSFGMSRTLLCPYVYLAHYDLVGAREGRAELAASGLEPELLRLSVGAEPVEEIVAELARALG
ncbi:MAG: PLP-dependent transferase [Opitutae bacterium]|nr:PLP-dependent transferase [Opitutae bacterium]